MGDYITTSDLEDVFGSVNISEAGSWADINEDGNATTISDRITVAISYAEALVNNSLRSTRYKLPLSTADQLVQTITATLAGDHLYRSKGLYDDDTTSKVAALLERAEEHLEAIASGRIRLDVTLSHNGPTAPTGVS